jgi:hypothetical protein
MTRARRPIRKKRLDGLCIIRSTASKICYRGISLKTLVTLRNEHAFRQRGPRMALTNFPLIDLDQLAQLGYFLPCFSLVGRLYRLSSRAFLRPSLVPTRPTPLQMCERNRTLSARRMCRSSLGLLAVVEMDETVAVIDYEMKIAK